MWFKVDDNFFGNPKISMLRDERDEALALWVIAGSWCGRYETDGEIYPEQVLRLGFSLEAADALVDAGLWERDEIGVYQFHDWEQYQPSRAELSAKRDADRQRKEAARLKKADNTEQNPRRVPKESTRSPTGVLADSALPEPEPEPVKNLLHDSAAVAPKADSKQTRGTRLPENWQPSQKLIEFAATTTPSVVLAWTVPQFRDYWHSRAGAGGVKLDWDLTFKTWLRREHKQNVERGWTEPRDTTQDWWHA